MHKVSVRGGFSDRNNIEPINKVIQLKDLDSRTRIQLFNQIIELYHYVYNELNIFNSADEQKFYKHLIGTVYSEPIDYTKTYYTSDIFKIISSTIEKGKWDEVLTLIEAIIRYWVNCLYNNYNNSASFYIGREQYVKRLFESINKCFEREFVGYRFINGIISPISDEYEIEAITTALETKTEQVRNHLVKANRLISDREHPDYANSIKESISSVEAICKIILKDNTKEATLGRMLTKLKDKGIQMNDSLRVAFMKLYEYSSSAKGIRHTGEIDGPSASFEEAKFMLVSCAAFVNYLTALHAD